MFEALENKKYFSIGQAGKITGVPAYCLRYWESTFGLLRPLRKDSGHRLYTKNDIEKILEVKDLVYRRKMTLEGAKKQLSKRPARTALKGGYPYGEETVKVLHEIHRELCAILKEC